MIALHELTGLWTGLFFSQQSVLPLAVLRILIGSVSALNLMLLLKDHRLLFGTHGLYPHEVFIRSPGRHALNPWSYLPGHDQTACLMILSGVVASLCLAAGFFTRTSAFALFAILFALQNRNPFVWCAYDYHVKLVALLLSLSDAGAELSIDAWSFLPAGVTAVAWPLRLIQFHVMFIYFNAVIWKLHGASWRDGSAVELAIGHTNYGCPDTVPDAIRQNPFVMRLLTYGTLLVEFLLGTVIIVRELSPYIVGLGIAFHLALQRFISTQLFQICMISLLICFMPADLLARLIFWVFRFAGANF